jgi:hypothetical protein
MSQIYTDSKTSNIANTKLKKNDRGNEIKRNFTNLVIDFNVLQYIVGFGIAISFREFLTKLIESVIIRFGIESELLISFLVLMSMIILLYFLVFNVFYKYIYKQDNLHEKTFELAISELRKEEAKKEIMKDKETKKHIEKNIEIDKKKKIESFSSRFYI